MKRASGRQSAREGEESPPSQARLLADSLSRFHLLMAGLAVLFTALSAVGWALNDNLQFLHWLGIYSTIPALGLLLSERDRRRRQLQNAVSTMSFCCSICAPMTAVLVPDVIAPVFVGPAIAAVVAVAYGTAPTRRFAVVTALVCYLIAQLKLVLMPVEATMSQLWVTLMNAEAFIALALTSWMAMSVYVGRLEILISTLRRARRDLRAVRSDLADANRGLEARVAERTRDWQQALIEVERAADLRTAFLRTMTHASRTPLHALLGFVDLMDHTDLNDDQRRHLAQVEERVAELGYIIEDANLIEQLLNDSLVEYRNPASVRQLVDGAVDKLRAYAKAREVRFTVRFGPGVPEGALMDLGQMRGVLERLLRIGAQISPPGRVEVIVSQTVRAMNPTLRILVKGASELPNDRLAAAVKAPLGDARYSVEHSHASGLVGLNIATKLAGRMQGRIGCDSRRDNGFCITCDIPIQVSLAQAALARRDPSARHRVLVVEDNAVNARLLELALTRAGYEVDVRSNGREALEACQQTAYSVALMDVNMPVMNGIDAAREIRRLLPRELRPSILALTAVEDDEIRTKCMGAGMVDTLYKPMSMQAVCAAVSRAIGQIAAEVT